MRLHSLLKPRTRVSEEAEVRPRLGQCWEWTGAIVPLGYGVVSVGGRTKYAHRVSYELKHGVSLDRKEVIRHRCDNRKCVRPSHLLSGTQRDNVADMIARGRQSKHQARVDATLNGKRVARRKLTPKQALRAYRAAEKGEPWRSVGARFGVHEDTIRDIMQGRTWSHITGLTCPRHTWRNK